MVLAGTCNNDSFVYKEASKHFDDVFLEMIIH